MKRIVDYFMQDRVYTFLKQLYFSTLRAISLVGRLGLLARGSRGGIQAFAQICEVDRDL